MSKLQCMEVSHFYYQHSLYPSPISAKTRIEQLNYLHLSRAAEISADRAGFLASGNLENSLRAMLKITSGLTDEHINFNYSSYLDQLRELKELIPVKHGESDLKSAMKLVARTQNGPKEQIPSMGCNIKWIK